MVESGHHAGDAPPVAGPPPVKVSERDARRLDTLEARIQRHEGQADAARLEWARLVREVGVAAVARRMGIARQTLTERIRAIESRNE